MKTITMFFIRTNNIMMRDCWSLRPANSDECWVSETADFILPDGYSVSETVAGNPAIFDAHDPTACVISTAYNGNPLIISCWDMIILDRVDDPAPEIPMFRGTRDALDALCDIRI